MPKRSSQKSKHIPKPKTKCPGHWSGHFSSQDALESLDQHPTISLAITNVVSANQSPKRKGADRPTTQSPHNHYQGHTPKQSKVHMSCFEAKTHYELLGVPTDADLREIRTAYRKTVMVIHPDRNDMDEHSTEHTKAVNIAYNTLRDPSKRIRYNLDLRDSRNRTGPTKPRRHHPKPKKQGREKRKNRERPDPPQDDHPQNEHGIWTPASTGNGWICRLARANVWIGHRAGNPMTVTVFIQRRWEEDKKTVEDAEHLRELIQEAAEQCRSTRAATSAIDTIIDHMSKEGNLACGTQCRVCKQQYHDHWYATCYPCREKRTSRQETETS